jgi:hypothetical protein
MLREVLTDFGEISGLKCNLEKTHIMAVGNRNLVNADMRRLNFTFVDELCLLGLKITHDLSSLSLVHNTTISKMRNICNFWARFNLSIPGRINIAKSLLLSQVNYLGCIINPTAEQFTAMDQIISGFILGRTNISKERLYLDPTEGGLGMICLKNFLVAQQAIWVKRAHQSTRDCWRFDLKELAKGECLTISTDNINVDSNPILHNIAASFNTFKRAFFNRNDNYKDALLLNNPILQRGQRDRGQLNHAFFNQHPAVPYNVLAQLKFSDIFRDGAMLPLAEINQTQMLGLNLLTYMRLGQACTYFLGN